MTESAKQKLARLTERLLERTRADRLSWMETDQPDAFVAVLQGGSVIVSGPSSNPWFELVVSNDRGAVIERARVDPVGNAFLVGPDEVLNRAIPLLHEAARRQVHDVDRALDSFLDQLG